MTATREVFMSTFSARLTVINGRGEGRQVVKLARNLEAEDRGDAQIRVEAWARELGLGSFMDQDDTRCSYDVALGAESGLS